MAGIFGIFGVFTLNAILVILFTASAVIFSTRPMNAGRRGCGANDIANGRCGCFPLGQHSLRSDQHE
jgi:hypothetical protein